MKNQIEKGGIENREMVNYGKQVETVKEKVTSMQNKQLVKLLRVGSAHYAWQLVKGKWQLNLIATPIFKTVRLGKVTGCFLQLNKKYSPVSEKIHSLNP